MERSVKQGDHVPRIAHAAGHADGAIWNHPENAALARTRENPCVLHPGDRIFVPEKRPGSDDAPTEQRHRYSLAAAPLHLKLAMLDRESNEDADSAFTLRLDGEEYAAEAGLVEARISRTATDGELAVADRHLAVRIGYLDPLDELSGQKARLNNLGYLAGTSPEDDMTFRSAVEEFQCDQSLGVDGICGPKTQARLLQVHGC